MFTVKGKIGRRTYEITWHNGVIQGDRDIIPEFHHQAEVASGHRLSLQTLPEINHLKNGYSVLQLAEIIFDSMSVEGDLPEGPGDRLEPGTIQ